MLYTYLQFVYTRLHLSKIIEYVIDNRRVWGLLLRGADHRDGGPPDENWIWTISQIWNLRMKKIAKWPKIRSQSQRP